MIPDTSGPGLHPFPAARPAIRNVVPATTTIVDSAATTRRGRVWRTRPAASRSYRQGMRPNPIYLTTDDAARFARTGTRFLGTAIAEKDVNSSICRGGNASGGQGTFRERFPGPSKAFYVAFGEACAYSAQDADFLAVGRFRVRRVRSLRIIDRAGIVQDFVEGFGPGSPSIRRAVRRWGSDGFQQPQHGQSEEQGNEQYGGKPE